jgi:hypothetical protein
MNLTIKKRSHPKHRELHRSVGSISFYTSAVILTYLAFTYVFFLNFIFGGGDYLLPLNHIALICFLVITQWKRRFPVPHGGIVLFGIFIAYILVNKLIQSFKFGEFSFKSEIVFILANFCIGYILTLNLKKINPVEQRRFAYLYYLITGIIVVVFIYNYVGTDKYERIFIGYPDTFHDSYQTLSAYLFRFLLVGIVLYALSRNEPQSSGPWKYIFLVAVIFGIISLLSISKKEVALFLFLAFTLYIDSSKHKALAIAFFSLIISLIVHFLSDILFTFISSVERSFSTRLAIISEEFNYLMENAGIMGSPYIYEQMDMNYPHSFLLSMLISYGYFGVILSWSCVTFSLYMLWKNNRNKVLFIVVMAIFSMTNIATHFDYMVFWFLLGLISPIMVASRPLGQTQVLTR